MQSHDFAVKRQEIRSFLARVIRERHFGCVTYVETRGKVWLSFNDDDEKKRKKAWQL